MRTTRALGILVLIASAACGREAATTLTPTSSPTAPALTPPPAGIPFSSGAITFSGLADGAFSSYSENGATIQSTKGNWVVGAGYGNPRPFIQFDAAGGTEVVGEIQLTAGGSAFTFEAVDLYSSTTQIPYTFTGLRNGAAVFSVSGRVPNTFGRFATVPSGNASASIDTLIITLTNTAAPCCRNPMGLDNIVLR